MFKNKLMTQLFLIFLTLICCEKSLAQLISIKTVPLATGNQFTMFPSKNMGAGNLSIAIDDLWSDPFANPAKGNNLEQTYFFSSPTLYHITGNNGSAKTLPMGLLYKKNDWFGGATITIQQLEQSDLGQSRFNLNSPYKKLGESFSDNMYAYGSLGKNINKWDTAIGASFFYANLDAVEGIELLYPESQNIEQFGNVYDFRLGLLHKTSNDQEVEAVILYNRYNMTHNVFYQDWIWNSAIEQSVSEERFENNLDKSRTMGVHLGYVKPLTNSNWKFGSILTGNWKSHPKIPNYELMNIPRDPGSSWAYNLGIGFAEIDEDTSFGFEIIYEPIWSNTWADAAENVTTRSGRIISAGGKTIENDFSFSNWIIRFGLSKDAFPFGFQLGLQVQSINYSLDQYNYVEEFRRKQREHWKEWTATWGLMMNLQSFELHYTGKLVIGTGRPGVNSGLTLESSPGLADKNILLAPNGNLFLDDAFVFMHRFTIAVPIR